ncbi:hypothetical protein LJC07_02620 [Christensenellaceae bacterium OttesenSCG-928-L17]|nr:hypothetical protein [Christensenellaceae bacterium OttesenSCG-928-L17]
MSNNLPGNIIHYVINITKDIVPASFRSSLEYIYDELETAILRPNDEDKAIFQYPAGTTIRPGFERFVSALGIKGVSPISSTKNVGDSIRATLRLAESQLGGIAEIHLYGFSTGEDILPAAIIIADMLPETEIFVHKQGIADIDPVLHGCAIKVMESIGIIIV